MKEYILIIAISFFVVNMSAQNCKPAYQNTDDFTNETVKGYGGKIVSGKLLTMSGYSVAMYFFIEEYNEELRVIGNLQLIFETKNGYELAKDQYLQKGETLDFALKLSNGKVLAFSSSNPKLESQIVGNTHGILITGVDILGDGNLELLQENEITKVRYALGDKKFDKETKTKLAKKVKSHFQCIESNSIKKEITGEVDETSMKMLVGNWVNIDNKKMKITFNENYSFIVSLGKQTIEGTYSIIDEQFITNYTYKGKVINDSEEIVELTENMFSIKGTKGIVTYKKVN